MCLMTNDERQKPNVHTGVAAILALMYLVLQQLRRTIHLRSISNLRLLQEATMR